MVCGKIRRKLNKKTTMDAYLTVFWDAAPLQESVAADLLLRDYVSQYPEGCHLQVFLSLMK
jgi:hypothetical protein